jgi:LPXTG-motif cell wall-anchored protein
MKNLVRILLVALGVASLSVATVHADDPSPPAPEPTPTELDPCLDTDADGSGSTLVYHLPCTPGSGQLSVQEWCASGYYSPYQPGDASDPCTPALPTTGASPRVAAVAAATTLLGIGALVLRRRKVAG